MKAAFWIKLALGLLLIAALIMLGYRMVDGLTNAITNIMGGGIIEETDEDFPIETPEPLPTMPAYMGEDGFYDNAGSVGGE